MTTYMDKQQKSLLGYYHKLCHDLGMSEDDRRAMLYQNYQVESSADLDNHQLTDLVHTLEGMARPEVKQRDQLRKRAIAAIGGYLTLVGRAKADKAENMRYIKSIACRSTGYEDFNKIPNERLRNLYYAFHNKQKDERAAKQEDCRFDVRHQMWEFDNAMDMAMHAAEWGIIGEA